MRLVLASASSRRAALLDAAGFAFDTLVVNIDERPRPGEPADHYVRRLATEKSAAALNFLRTRCEISPRVPRTPRVRPAGPIGPAPHTSISQRALNHLDDQTVVLGADTAVVIDGRILGKPSDDDEAADMLRRLSGRRHEVMTGVSLRTRNREIGSVEVTTVEFASLRDQDIAWYVLSSEGRDKAGAYAIQGLAARFIPRIEGSYSNVVGLPVSVVQRLLAEIASGPRSGYAGR